MSLTLSNGKDFNEERQKKHHSRFIEYCDIIDAALISDGAFCLYLDDPPLDNQLIEEYKSKGWKLTPVVWRPLTHLCTPAGWFQRNNAILISPQ